MNDDSGFNINGPDSLAKATLYIVIGLAIVSYGGYDYIQQTEAVRDSVQVDATVTERTIEEDRRTSSNPDIEYEPAIEFEYTYKGTQYTGTKVYPADIQQNYETRSAAESAIEGYEQGVETTAYVEPDEPDDAFLENKTSNAPIIAIGIGGVFAFLSTIAAVRQL